jgi:hypothetical protein
MAGPNEFVKRLTENLKAKAASSEQLADMEESEAATQAAQLAGIPELFTFAGFLGEAVAQPGVPNKQWQLMYLDLQLKNWLLVEQAGVISTESVTEDKAPEGQMDVLWVTADTAVGIGSGSQSLEAQFLTGDFTRAADFRTSVGGGTLAAATGIFCDAQSIGCCRPTNR